MDPKRRLLGLISLWIMFSWWQYLIASINILIASLAWYSLNLSFSSIKSYSSPPVNNSITRQTCFSSSNISINLTIFGWSTCCKIYISVYNISLSSSVIFLLEYTFTANYSLVTLFFTFLTVEFEPLPIVHSILYTSFIFLGLNLLISIL